MAEKRSEYRFTEKPNFSVYLVRQLVFDPFFQDHRSINTVRFMSIYLFFFFNTFNLFQNHKNTKMNHRVFISTTFQ